MFEAYGVALAANGFYVLHTGLFGCVNLCCKGFMDINSDF
jgi:hypothetical protein